MKPPIDYFSSDSLRHDLKGKTVRGGMWLAISQGIGAVVSLISIPILARLLDPADFGLFAMVAVFKQFCSTIADSGLSTATIQREKLSHHQVSNLFWFGIAMGTGIAAVLAASSPLIAWVYGEPRLIAVTCAMSLSFIVGSLSIQQQALLRRASRFGALSAISITSILISTVATILLAWYTRSYWALVLSPIIHTIVGGIGTWVATGWRPSLPRRNVGSRQLVRFGANLSGAQIANQLAVNADRFLIGAFIGAAPLGLYDRAFQLLVAPIRKLNAPLTNLVMPALSRTQNDPNRYRMLYFGTITILLLVQVPLAATVVASSDWVVPLLFGFSDKWAPLLTIFPILSVGLVMLPLFNCAGMLFISQGRDRELLAWQSGEGLFRVACVSIGLYWGIVGVAYAAVVRLFISTPAVYWFLGRSGPVQRRELLQLLLISVSTFAVTLAGAVVVRKVLPADPSPIVGLIAVGVVSFTVSTVLLFVFPQTRGRLLMLGRQLPFFKMSRAA